MVISPRTAPLQPLPSAVVLLLITFTLLHKGSCFLANKCHSSNNNVQKTEMQRLRGGLAPSLFSNQLQWSPVQQLCINQQQNSRFHFDCQAAKSRMEWIDECESTQDEVRREIQAMQYNPPAGPGGPGAPQQQRGGGGGVVPAAAAAAAPAVFALGARLQTRGRGTRGRTWAAEPGNLFLTIAVPMQGIPCPISLFPLRIGTLIAPEIKQLVNPDCNVRLKWPNDVLIDDKKVCGVLVESEPPYLLVGVGVNVARAPAVPQGGGADAGRPATCLADHGAANPLLPPPGAGPAGEAAGGGAVEEALGAAITERVANWFSQGPGTESAATVTAAWDNHSPWGHQITLRDTGEAVTALGLAPDGTLRVRDSTGRERRLVTEYLY